MTSGSPRFDARRAVPRSAPHPGDGWKLDVLDIATTVGVRTVRVFRPLFLDPAVPIPLAVFQDGQKAFADEGASWHAAAAISRLVEDGHIAPIIAVGVDNAGEKRAIEYSHVVPFPRQPGASAGGEEYESLLVDEILPRLRERYPLTREAAQTAVIGSSLGGLVSYHLAFRRPDVFGLAGVLSPYLAHIDPHRGSEHRVWEAFGDKGPRRVWLDVGDHEATLTVSQVLALRDHLLDVGYVDGADLAWRIHRGATHHEDFWAERLPSVLLHLFAVAPSPVVEARIDLPSPIPAGQKHVPVSPLVTHANGMRRNALTTTSVVPPDAATPGIRWGDVALRDPGSLTVLGPGPDGSIEQTVEVVPSPPVVRLEITVAGEGLEDEDALTYSWLPLARTGPSEFGGVFRLPVGLAFDGVVTRHSDSFSPVDPDGQPQRWPVRLIADERLKIPVSRWMPTTDPL